MNNHTLSSIEEPLLRKHYTSKGKSAQEIAAILGCSVNKVNYWLKKYGIPKRSISDALYVRCNPSGDPFHVKPIKTLADAKLWGMGVGLYWGEGTKANLHAVRLGNTDPALIKVFILFLAQLFGVDRGKLRFGLQIFTDINEAEALQYWTKQLDIKPSQFYKVTVTISGSLGTYRKRSRYGVVTVYYHNKKLRDILMDTLPR